MYNFTNNTLLCEIWLIFAQSRDVISQIYNFYKIISHIFVGRNNTHFGIDVVDMFFCSSEFKII